MEGWKWQGDLGLRSPFWNINLFQQNNVFVVYLKQHFSHLSALFLSDCRCISVIFSTLFLSHINWKGSKAQLADVSDKISPSNNPPFKLFQFYHLHLSIIPWTYLPYIVTYEYFWDVYTHTSVWWIFELCLKASIEELIALIASDIYAVLNLPDKPNISTKSDISVAIHLSLTPFLPLHYKLMWQYGSIQHQ